MKKVKSYIIAKESIEDHLKARRFNPCLEITFQDGKGSHTHKISAGYDDNIHVFHEERTTFVLSHNPRLDYVGMEVFKGREKVEDVFLQGHEANYVFGNKERSPKEMVQQLMDMMNT